MERKPLSFPITITVTGATNIGGSVAGSGNNTTPANSAIANAGGYLRQIIVVAPVNTATFDFRIANPNGRNVLKRTQLVGELVEDMATPLPAGTYTCYLENCSHNGDYSCEVVYAEVY